MITNFKIFEFEWYKPEDKLKLENCKKHIGKYIIYKYGIIGMIKFAYVNKVKNTGYIELCIYEYNKSMKKYTKYNSGEMIDMIEILAIRDNLKDAIEEYEMIENSKKYNL